MKHIEIISEKNCCGCGSCGVQCPVKAITFTQDSTGFSYPQVNENICVNCGLCLQACPLIAPPKILGNPIFYGGYNMDAEIRRMSSSGGCFSSIAEIIFQENGIVAGSAFFPDGTRHICVDNKEDMSKLRGSKYVESRVIDTWPEIIDYLKLGKKLLFSGTPCQVAAARKILNKWEVQVTFIETICLGVPSPLMFQKYLLWKDHKLSAQTLEFKFRYKDQQGHRSQLQHTTTKGTYYYDIGDDPYMKAFYRGLSLRPCCYECHFKGFPRTADITLGDFWGVEFVFPEFNPAKGVSLIICNSDKGRKLLSRLSHSFILKQTDRESAEKANPMLNMSAKEPEERKRFWEDFNTLQPTQLFVKYKLMRNKKERLRDSLHHLASSVWHIMKK